jgi:hypothetical protein
MTKAIANDRCVDNACLVHPILDDPRCSVESYIEYRRAIVITPQELEEMIDSGVARIRYPRATDAFLEKLRKGAEDSDRLDEDAHNELWHQGILPPL